ncbi:MAG: uroporphyrinogen decarboxylase family protein [Dehalococcoidia bacterium]|nr:uroporphyrinogen decarboxylase family protein [Dehalococcoidia bacterium]
MSDRGQIVDEKTARLRAAISLEPHDQVPVASMADFWPVRYTQNTMQEAYYSIDVAAESYKKAFARWDSWDAFNPLIQSVGPLLDATGSRRYNIPGRDISPQAEFQHPDFSLMAAEEYPEFTANPLKFHAEKLLPRMCTRIGSDDATISATAWIKAAFFFAQYMAEARSYARLWTTEYAIPPLFKGQSLYVPIDWIADKIRGFHQGLLDVKQRPAELRDACEALVPFILGACLYGVKPGDYPLIFNPQHVSPFLSPRDYQKVYWPTYKKMVDDVVGRGFKVWSLFEANQEQHLEHLQDLPKGKVVAHFESTDLAKAKKALGGRLCIAGGMPAVLLTRGTPQEVKEHTISILKLFEDEPGFIMTCCTTLPSTTRPENLTAWLDTVKEYGRIGGGPSASSGRESEPAPADPKASTPAGQDVIRSWDAVKAEFGEIKGDESIIKESWENLERLSLTFLYWMLR